MLIVGSVYEAILVTDDLETSPSTLSLNQICCYFVMLCSDFTGLRTSGSKLMVENDQSPARFQRLEYVVEHRFCLGELMVRVRNQHGIC